ncbi:MAG: hypothetical protein ACK5AC_20895 [Planctomycetota bacterium]
MDMQLQTEKLQHLKNQPQMKRRLASFQLGEEPDADPCHAGGLLQGQTSPLPSLAHQPADILWRYDLDHLCT